MTLRTSRWSGAIQEIAFSSGCELLNGNLAMPDGAQSLIVFVHGSGSSRFSPRNRYVANQLNLAKHATFLFDLLTEREEQLDVQTRELRFDIDLLAERTMHALEALSLYPELKHLRTGLFGASTGAAAALIAAAMAPDAVSAIVSRGGRPDLAAQHLQKVKSPSLLIVGEADTEVLRLNEYALRQMQCEKALAVVPRATHLFEEPGALEQVADLACNWFSVHLLR